MGILRETRIKRLIKTNQSHSSFNLRKKKLKWVEIQNYNY